MEKERVSRMNDTRFTIYGCRSLSARQGMTGWFRLSVLLVSAFSVLMMPPFSAAGDQKAEKTEEQKLLERYAARSLFRLKQSIKDDGFYNARVSLNVWQSNAIEAGTFDQALYDELKTQIYKKSIQENLKWFEIFAKQKDFSDARTCLRLWRMHAEEIGVFDEEKYFEMLERLK